jgi:hypothetical protein
MLLAVPGNDSLLESQQSEANLAALEKNSFNFLELVTPSFSLETTFLTSLAGMRKCNICHSQVPLSILRSTM